MRPARPLLVLGAAAILASGLTGGAVAGSVLTGDDIADSSLTGDDIAAGSVTSSHVQDQSLRIRDLAPTAVNRLTADAAGEQGPQGPPGVAGPAGPQGPPGPGATEFGTDTSSAAAGKTAEDCMLGEVRLAAGRLASGMPAAGQTLYIQYYDSLYSLLGTQYGGNGETTFRLPDLRKAAPNGLTYYICLDGIYPEYP